MTSRSSSGDRSTVAKGRAAEDTVARYLESFGFEILERNVRSGRLEIDLVARRGALIVVCEVRSRKTAAFGHPAETIDRAKQLRIRRSAAALIEQRGWRGSVRFDVATLVGDGRGGTQLEYYEAAF
ncbi:MAG: YraN family protein [Deltaproteobacteria bacterium]|nr:YraN family protein [Deltaproteobacteria bacterium]